MTLSRPAPQATVPLLVDMLQAHIRHAPLAAGALPIMQSSTSNARVRAEESSMSTTNQILIVPAPSLGEETFLAAKQPTIIQRGRGGIIKQCETTLSVRADRTELRPTRMTDRQLNKALCSPTP